MPKNATQTQLRAQLLGQLQRGQVVRLAPPPGSEPPSLKRRALNNLVAAYLAAAEYGYSLSVFGEESGAAAAPPLSDEEMLEVLHIEQHSSMHVALAKARADGGAACIADC